MFFEENLSESIFFENKMAWGYVWHTDLLLRGRVVADGDWKYRYG